jgi:hypothetical protein
MTTAEARQIINAGWIASYVPSSSVWSSETSGVYGIHSPGLRRVRQRGPNRCRRRLRSLS